MNSNLDRKRQLEETEIEEHQSLEERIVIFLALMGFVTMALIMVAVVCGLWKIFTGG